MSSIDGGLGVTFDPNRGRLAGDSAVKWMIFDESWGLIFFIIVETPDLILVPSASAMNSR